MFVLTLVFTNLNLSLMSGETDLKKMITKVVFFDEILNKKRMDEFKRIRQTKKLHE
jgi:hypothetical protein